MSKIPNHKIDEIEGIGPVYRDKLVAAGIADTDTLLKECAGKAGRDKVAKATGVTAPQLLKWANMADLMRINGVGKQFAELLEASGVDTVKELATRRADNLTAAMVKVNTEKKLCKTNPSEQQVSGWVAEAKTLPPLITH